MMRYHISCWVSGRSYGVSSDAILAEFARLELSVPASLTELLRHGSRYSFEDFDVLSSAMRELYKLDSGVWQRIGGPSPCAGLAIAGASGARHAIREAVRVVNDPEPAKKLL